jgi:ferredoxin
LSELQVLGDGLEALRVGGFRLPVKKDITARLPSFLTDMVAARLSIRPRPDAAVCTACGKCAEICPEGAISIVDRAARVDLSKCIKCYCCHELCEQDAIELERPLLLRLANRIGG